MSLTNQLQLSAGSLSGDSAFKTRLRVGWGLLGMVSGDNSCIRSVALIVQLVHINTRIDFHGFTAEVSAARGRGELVG